MSTTYPASIDDIGRPLAADKLGASNPPHATIHNFELDSIAALKNYVGVSGGAANLLEALYKAGLPRRILSIGIPFVLFGGTGAAGFQFTGTLGAFTCTEIMASSGLFLDYGYCYLPANFGGQSYPAGWYYFTMSSTTAGIVYMDQYVSGQPVHPVSPTPFPVNLSGYITQATTEVTAISGFTFPGNVMGPNGYVESYLNVFGTSSAVSKLIRVRGGASALIAYVGTTTNTYGSGFFRWQNKGSLIRQKATRPNSISAYGTTIYGATVDSSAQNTGVDFPITVTLASAANTDSVALLGVNMSSVYAP